MTVVCVLEVEFAEADSCCRVLTFAWELLSTIGAAPATSTVLVLAAGATIRVAVAVTPAGQVLLSYLSAQWDTAKYWLTGLL